MKAVRVDDYLSLSSMRILFFINPVCYSELELSHIHIYLQSEPQQNILEKRVKGTLIDKWFHWLLYRQEISLATVIQASDLIGYCNTASDTIGYSITDSNTIGYCNTDIDTIGYSISDSNTIGYCNTDIDTIGYCNTDNDTIGYCNAASDTIGCCNTDIDTIGYCNTSSDMISYCYVAAYWLV